MVKGENADYLNFLLFPQSFQKVVKTQDCVVKDNMKGYFSDNS